MSSEVMKIKMRIECKKKAIEKLENELEKEFYTLDEAMKEEEKELVMI